MESTVLLVTAVLVLVSSSCAHHAAPGIQWIDGHSPCEGSATDQSSQPTQVVSEADCKQQCKDRTSCDGFIYLFVSTSEKDCILKECPAPVIVCPDPAAVSTDPGETRAVVSFTLPTATDNGGSTLAVEQTDTTGRTSGSYFPRGTTTLTFRTTDDIGNTATCSIVITVTAPTSAPPRQATFQWRYGRNQTCDADSVEEISEDDGSDKPACMETCETEPLCDRIKFSYVLDSSGPTDMMTGKKCALLKCTATTTTTTVAGAVAGSGTITRIENRRICLDRELVEDQKVLSHTDGIKNRDSCRSKCTLEIWCDGFSYDNSIPSCRRMRCPESGKGGSRR